MREAVRFQLLVTALGLSSFFNQFRRAKGFSLIELLVVIAILAVIMSILLPSLNRAIYKADTLTCSQNIKNLTTTFFLYTDDFEGYFPTDRKHPNGQNDPTYMGFTKSGSTPAMEVILKSYFHSSLRRSDFFICPTAGQEMYDGSRNNSDGDHNGKVINRGANKDTKINGHFVTRKDSNNRQHFYSQYMFFFDFFGHEGDYVDNRKKIGDMMVSTDGNAYRTIISDFHTRTSFGKAPSHYEYEFKYDGNNSTYEGVKLNSFYSFAGGGNNYGSDDGSVAIIESDSPWQYNKEVETPHGKWRFKNNGSKWYEYNREVPSQWNKMGEFVVPIVHKVR
jgi:prepilin-type N-terminal cleavage/methylation domain-containing protein